MGLQPEALERVGGLETEQPSADDYRRGGILRFCPDGSEIVDGSIG